MRETKLTILHQGEVKLSHLKGYMVVGDGDAVCFFIDPVGRAYIDISSQNHLTGCPTIHISNKDETASTEVEFSEFKGWRFHSGGGGKSIAIALVRDK